MRRRRSRWLTKVAVRGFIIGSLLHCSFVSPQAVRTEIRLLSVCRRKSHGCRVSAGRPGRQRESMAGAWGTRWCGAERAVARTIGTPRITSRRMTPATGRSAAGRRGRTPERLGHHRPGPTATAAGREPPGTVSWSSTRRWVTTMMESKHFLAIVIEADELVAQPSNGS